MHPFMCILGVILVMAGTILLNPPTGVLLIVGGLMTITMFIASYLR